jgi:hypothetical protein
MALLLPCLLAHLLPSAALASLPITCTPLEQYPDFPTYHIMGHVSGSLEKGLGREAINDCSGVIKHGGMYHVFHQCCQNHWDHVVSKDLIHWTRLPPPVKPNQTDRAQWYDHSGSYDGGVSIVGTPAATPGPTIVYDVIECKIRMPNPKFKVCPPGCKCIPNATVAGAGSGGGGGGGGERLRAPMDPPWMGIARPTNVSDPYLLEWAKDAANPINFTGGPQTGGANAGSIWWNEQLSHFNLLALSHGAGEAGRLLPGDGDPRAGAPQTMGKMYRYETTDATFHNWTRKEVFSQHSGEGGQWFMRLPRTVSGGAPPPGSPTHILTSGDGGAFVFGNYHASNDSFVEAGPEYGISNTASGPDSGWMATQNASGRVLNIGWATVCGGASALTTLREIKYDATHKALVSNPVEELVGLRTAALATITQPLTLPAGETAEIPNTKGVAAAASSDTSVIFTLPVDGSAAVFGVCVLVGPITNASRAPPLSRQQQRGAGSGRLGAEGPWRPSSRCGDAANSTGIAVMANLSSVDPETRTRTGTVSIGKVRRPLRSFWRPFD